MHHLAFDKRLKNQNPTCSDLITMAERELAAFSSAVAELFGSEQAEISTEDWLHELVAIADLPVSTREWRLLTVKVLTRLASRVDASSISPPSQTLAYSH